MALGLTREAVAHAAGVGAATVYRVEAGRTTPNVSTLVVICAVLGLTAEDLDLQPADLDHRLAAKEKTGADAR